VYQYAYYLKVDVPQLLYYIIALLFTYVCETATLRSILENIRDDRPYIYCNINIVNWISTYYRSISQSEKHGTSNL